MSAIIAFCVMFTSSISVSNVKRLRMRPSGVVSKYAIGARSTRAAAAPYSRSAARTPPSSAHCVRAKQKTSDAAASAK